MKQVIEDLADSLICRMTQSVGVRAYVQDYRAGFENWLHVEACGILRSRCVEKIEIEKPLGKEGVDICFWEKGLEYAVELKVIAITAGIGGTRANRTIATSLEPVLKDISILRTKQNCHRTVMLFLFPFSSADETSAKIVLSKKKYWKEIQEQGSLSFNKLVSIPDENGKNAANGFVFIIKVD